MGKILGKKPVTNHMNCGTNKGFNKENRNKFRHMRVFRLEVNTELLRHDEEGCFARKLVTLTEFTTMLIY